MTYASQGTIQATDYNGFVSTTAGANLNDIWSTGSTDKGWGQTAIDTVSTAATTGSIASVVIAANGVLTVTSGTYAVGQAIVVSGTLSAGTISGTANYTTPATFYIIDVVSATSIIISATPSGSAVTSTAGTATPGGTFTLTSAASLVTATQWATLVNTLSSAGSQTNTTLTTRTAPTTGTTISILANVNTDLTSVTTNRGNAAASGTQYTAWTGTNSKTTATSGATWTITITNTITFPSADEARYFWNAGGLVKITCSKTATGATGDPPWNALATACGDIYISGRVNSASQTIAGVAYTGTTKVGGSGTTNTLTTTTGWYQLVAGAAATTIFKQFSATAPYTADYIQHTAAVDAGRTTLTIVTTWVASDGDPISGGTATSGATFGTAPATLVTYYPPATTYLTNSWGTPTVVAAVT